MTANIDRYFVLVALCFAGAGLFLGENMGRTGNHVQMPTHAHLMLAGCVFAAIYGLVYRAWPALKTGVLPLVQFALHVLGSLVLTTGLFMIFGGRGEEGLPVVFAAAGSMAVILSWALFIVHFVRRSGRPA